MAETGTNLNVQQSGNVPGLANARRAQEEDVQNQEIEQQRAEENRQAEVRQQEDLVSVRENKPGDVERRQIRVEGEILNVPSQDVPDNLGLRQNPQPDASVADLNQGIRDEAGLNPPTPRGPGSIGGGDVNDLQENTGGLENEPGFRQALDSADANATPADPGQPGAQSPLDVLPADAFTPRDETDVSTEPANNPVQGQGTDNLTESDAGLAATSTGRPNATNQILRQNAQEDADRQQQQGEQDNARREPERAQTERGQNIDRLV